ncbi:hypothetical protein QN277_016936 [Acacia crassicarpa]|uniref:SHSP domain-containing protein n=1 Tax=Acacia crassicarpa TaxID=499986 RepID=A0AAE1MXW1_9FABA|nr:hypothetical protein QN277_016936 [Acacia crassicarpa]
MAKSAAAYNVVYEDIEPFFEWHTEEDFHVLVVMLPGFRREEMKVQVTSNHILKVSGEEKKKDKTSVVRRFYKEFSVPREANINQIVAKFEDGKLYIKLPKTMTTKKPSPRHREKEEAVSKANKQVSQKKEEEDEAINKKKQVWKLMIVGFIVALVMLVLVIGIGFRSNAMQHYSSPLGTSDIQELFVDV